MAVVHPDPPFVELGKGHRTYYQYHVSPLAWAFMKTIPGSFAAEEEKLPPDVPFRDAMLLAYLDLLPTLLKRGHEGKWLAFGYGREWYAVDKTAHGAMAKLLRKYPEQRPYVWGTIEASSFTNWTGQVYSEWKAKKLGGSSPQSPENTPA